MLTSISLLEHVSPCNFLLAVSCCVHLHMCAFYLDCVKIVLVLLCMEWCHMQVENFMSYLIIWKVFKCIFIIIKERWRNIFVPIFTHRDSQPLCTARRMILPTSHHFRFYRKPHMCIGAGFCLPFFFFFSFFRYMWHFWNYQSNSTFMSPFKFELLHMPAVSHLPNEAEQRW